MRLALLLLFLSVPAYAACAHVQTKQQSPTAATRGSAATSLSESFTSTPTVGNIVIVYFTHFQGTESLNSITDNQTPGNSYTIVAKTNNGPVHTAIAWSIISTASGTFTVTGNLGTASDCVIGISEFSGNVASSPGDGTNTGTGTGTSYAAGSITPSQSGDLFISTIADDDSNQTYTAPTNWSKRAENGTGSTGMVLSSASFISTDSSAQSATWTSTTSANWVANIAAFKCTGVAAAAPPPFPVRRMTGWGR